MPKDQKPHSQFICNNPEMTKLEVSLLGKDLNRLNTLVNKGRFSPQLKNRYPLSAKERKRIGQYNWSNRDYTDRNGRVWKPLAIPCKGNSRN